MKAKDQVIFFLVLKNEKNEDIHVMLNNLVWIEVSSFPMIQEYNETALLKDQVNLNVVSKIKSKSKKPKKFKHDLTLTAEDFNIINTILDIEEKYPSSTTISNSIFTSTSSII